MSTTTLPTPKLNGSVKNEVFTSVFKTYNYDIFKIMSDNRNLNLLHVKRLVDSFKEEHLICPIIVNEKMEVIDGQHRLQATKETGSPVYYIVLKGYGIPQVQRLNTNQKNWTKMDYLQMYCAEGVVTYLTFKKFMDDFPDLGIQASERILTGKTHGSMVKNYMGRKMGMKDFEEGKLKIPDVKKSYYLAKKIMDFKQFYPNFHRGAFVSAIVPLIPKPDIYNHKEMIHKLSVCPIRMRDCNTVESYRSLLEDIYNYKRQKENKASFKYA